MSQIRFTNRIQHGKWGVAALLALAAIVFTGYVQSRNHESEFLQRNKLSPRNKATALETGTPFLQASDDRMPTSSSAARLEAEDRTFSPANDGWESESFIELAKQQLLELLVSIQDAASTQADHNNVAAISRFVTEDVLCQPLRPDNLREVLADNHIVVRRPPDAVEDSPNRRGVDRLAMTLRNLVSPFSKPNDIEFHLKFHGFSMLADSIVTMVDFESHGSADGGIIQQNATWSCTWTKAENELPRLTSITSNSFEEIFAVTNGATWFADCTEAVLKNNPSFHEQLVFGLNHWMQRIERSHGMQIYARTGLTVGDVNGDGLDDVYVCQPGGLPNRLFVQNSDGTATDRSRDSGVDWLDESHGALLVDLDNDGDQDLALACTAGVILMDNDSSGRFNVRQHLRVDRSVESLVAADYDNDGDLDLYVCVYRANSTTADDDVSATRFLYHDANNGGANRMFRNDVSLHQWQFTDVTRECGLDDSNRRWSMAAAWEDFDNDGDQDLYVANDYGQNCLYRNDDGHFNDIAKSAGVVDYGSGMSVSWGDYDRDGWMDLYVGNMFSSAGNRIATQQKFMASADDTTRMLYQRFAKGNSLFKNQEGNEFREVGIETAVEMARWAWSSLFVDINNDGWQDLVVANGFISANDQRDL